MGSLSTEGYGKFAVDFPILTAVTSVTSDFLVDVSVLGFRQNVFRNAMIFLPEEISPRAKMSQVLSFVSFSVSMIFPSHGLRLPCLPLRSCPASARSRPSEVFQKPEAPEAGPEAEIPSDFGVAVRAVRATSRRTCRTCKQKSQKSAKSALSRAEKR